MQLQNSPEPRECAQHLVFLPQQAYKLSELFWLLSVHSSVKRSRTEAHGHCDHTNDVCFYFQIQNSQKSSSYPAIQLLLCNSFD